jgi:hypothetical protein
VQINPRLTDRGLHRPLTGFPVLCVQYVVYFGEFD